MINTDQITIEFLQEKHVPELVVLYRDIFQKKVEENYFKIKYRLNDPKREQFTVIAISNGKVIGMLAAMDQSFLKLESKSKRLLMICDFFLIKEVRGKNVSDLLWNALLLNAKKNEFEFCYAIQSDQTYKFFKKMNWKDEVFLQRFHLKSQLGRLLKPLRLVFGHRYQELRFSSLLQKYTVETDVLANQLSAAYYQQNYDSDFISSKGFCKHYLVSIHGCLLYMKLDGIISVGYVRFSAQYDINKMLSVLKGMMPKVFVSEIVFQLQSNSQEARILSNFISPQPSFKLSSFPLLDLNYNTEDIRINYADMDVF